MFERQEHLSHQEATASQTILLILTNHKASETVIIPPLPVILAMNQSSFKVLNVSDNSNI